ncbi:MAG: cyanophycinase [Planctomycetota bacterium]|nr:cyanophycinase [Planctomycetota bacterium]
MRSWIRESGGVLLGLIALGAGGGYDRNLAPVRFLGPDEAALLVPEKAELHFVGDFRDAVGSDEVGFFYVDGPDGRITRRQDGVPEGLPLLGADGKPQYVDPGDPGYPDVALAAGNCQVLFASQAGRSGQEHRRVEMNADRFVACYVIQGSGTDQWRQAPSENKSPVWLSFEKANPQGSPLVRRARPQDPARSGALREYHVEALPTARPPARAVPGIATGWRGVVLTLTIVPMANVDDYSIFCEGEDFNGKPLPLRLSVDDGLLRNDYAFSGRPLRVTAISANEEDWLPVPATGRTLDDPAARSLLHGLVTVWPNGAVEFLPDDDGYWKPSGVGEELFFNYRLSDGCDTDEIFVRLARGFGHWGQTVDDVHDGQRMYLLAGGYPDAIEDARKEFFVRGSRLHDIVLISQGGDLGVLRDKVLEFADRNVRSVTSLSITTRAQAEDPRIARIVAGADAIWLGGGDQRIYHDLWQGTRRTAAARSRLFAALQDAARDSTAIGGTSAGMAVLGQAMYLNHPWDSVHASFAAEAPGSPRLQLISQRDSALPFECLSQAAQAPLHQLIIDPHFAERDRMGRLAAFVARAKLDGLIAGTPYGLGVDGDAAVLIEKQGAAWNWSVYGTGHAYLIHSNAAPAYDQRGRLVFSPINEFCLQPGQIYRFPHFTQGTPYVVLHVTGGTCYTTEHNGEMYRRAGGT